MSVSNPMADHRLTVLTHAFGEEHAVAYDAQPAERLATFTVPFKCKIVSATVTMSTATGDFGDIHIYGVSLGTPAALSAATGKTIAVDQTNKQVVLPATTSTTEYPANSIFDIRCTPSHASVASKVSISLAVLNTSSP